MKASQENKQLLSSRLNEVNPYGKRKKTILIVEDDSTTLKVYTTRLSVEGYEVVSTPNAKDVISLAQSHKPALFIVDMMLTDGDGFQVIKALRNEPLFKTIPIFALSNLGQANDIDEAMKRGATKYFVKGDTPLSVLAKEIKKNIQ